MRTEVAPPKRAGDPARDDPLVAELERLWSLSAAGRPVPASEPARRRVEVHGLLSKTVVYGWVGLLVAIAAAAPAADPAVHVPAWVDAASAAILSGAVGSALVAGLAPRVALTCSALAAGLGVPVGIACRATEHHAGSWWLVETGAFAALAVASVACLATRSRR
jgi:hypothetical protein